MDHVLVCYDDLWVVSGRLRDRIMKGFGSASDSCWADFLIYISE